MLINQDNLYIASSSSFILKTSAFIQEKLGMYVCPFGDTSLGFRTKTFRHIFKAVIGLMGWFNVYLRIIQMQRVSADGWPSGVLHGSTNWICDRPFIDVVFQAGTHVIASQDSRGSTVRWTSTSASRTRASTEEHAQTSSMPTTALALQASVKTILFQISYINIQIYKYINIEYI